MPEVAVAAAPETRRVAAHSALWWLVVIAYAVANIFMHEQVNRLAEVLIQIMGLWPFFWMTRILVVLGAAVILFCRRDFIREPGRLKPVLVFIVIGVVLDLSLVIYASERVHYPQYALLTWLAYRATGQPVPAALLSFLVGYVDEAHQHWMIYANDPIAYFDWNDNVLNLLGAVSALVLLPGGGTRKIPYRKVLAAGVLWTAAMSLLIFLFRPDPVLMRAHTDPSFWLTSNIKTHYHVLNALEGTLLLGFSWIVTFGYYGL
jgi:hypothetical protein